MNCNSQFGANQDKWFGELTKLHKENNHLLDKELSGKRFKFGDKKVNGKWFTRENGNLAFVIYGDRNSPDDVEHFQKYVSSSKIKFSLEYPILSKEYDIKKGYLTAAYLYLFSIFGYTWILQNHLNSLRNIIMTKGDVQINMSQFIFVKEKFDNPMIALSVIGDKLFLLFLFNNVITLLPTLSNPDLSYELNRNEKSELIENILQLNLTCLYEHLNYHFVVHYDKVLMMSDYMKKGMIKNISGLLILEDKIQMLTQPSNEKLEELGNIDSGKLRDVVINLRNT